MILHFLSVFCLLNDLHPYHLSPVIYTFVFSYSGSPSYRTCRPCKAQIGTIMRQKKDLVLEHFYDRKEWSQYIVLVLDGYFFPSQKLMFVIEFGVYKLKPNWFAERQAVAKESSGNYGCARKIKAFCRNSGLYNCECPTQGCQL